MRKSLFFAVFTIILSMAGLAQNGKISYQAVVRNSANQLVYDQDLDVTVGIANSETGTAVYTETHAVHSNANGLISLLIGDGTPVAGSNWEAIQWNHAWLTAVVSQGGTELATHHLPLSAVPYALYAEQVDPVALANYLTANHYLTEEVQVLSISNDTIYLTGGSWVKLPAGFSGDYNDLTNLPDLTQYATNAHLNDTLGHYATTSALKDSLTRYVDKEKLNDTLDHYLMQEVQVLSVSNDTLYLTGGSWVKLPQGFSGDYNDLTNLPDLTQYVTNTHLNDTLGHYYTSNEVNDTLAYYATTSALKDSLTRYVGKEKLNDTLSHYLMQEVQVLSVSNDTLYLTGGSWVKLPQGFSGDYNDLTNLPDLTQYATNAHLNDTLSLYPTLQTLKDTAANVRSALVDTAAAIRGDFPAVNNGQLTVITKGDTTRFTANQAGNDTVNLSGFVTTAQLNDTLNAYYTKGQVKDTLMNFARKDTLMNFARKDTLVNFARKDTLVNFARKDTLVNFARKDTLVNFARKDTLVNFARKDTLVNFARKDTLVNFARKDTLVNFARKDTLVNFARKDTLVNFARKDTLVNFATKDTLNAYYDTTRMKKAIHDTANVLRGEFPTVNDGQITIKVNNQGVLEENTFGVNQANDQTINITIPQNVAVNDGQLTIITKGDTTRFTANQSGNDTVNLSGFVTTAHLNDTLNAYYTKGQVKDTLVNFARKDTLVNFARKDTLVNFARKDTLVNFARKDTLVNFARKDTLVNFARKDTLVNFARKDTLVNFARKDTLVNFARKDTLVNFARKDTLVNFARKDTLVNFARKDTLVNFARKDTLVNFARKDTLVNFARKDTLVNFARKDTLVNFARKDTLVNFARKDTLVNFARKDTLVNFARKDTLVNFARKDTLVNFARKDTLVNFARKDTLVNFARKDTLVNFARKDTLVNFARKDTLVNFARKDTLVNFARKDTLVNFARKDTLVNFARKDTLVNFARKDTLVNFARKDTLVNFARKDTLVNFARKDTLVNFARKDTLVNFARKDTLVNFARKDTLVNFARKDTLVNFATKDTLNAYYDTTRMKKAIHDTADVLRGEFPVVNDARITIAVNRSTTTTETTVTDPTFRVNQANNQTVTITIPQETTVNNGQLAIVAAGDTTRFTANQANNDTVRLNKFATKDTLSKYTTTDKIDTIVNKHHFLTSDSALIVRMRDSIQKVNAHISADSLVLANRITNDSTKLVERIVADSTALAEKIYTDSLALAQRMDTAYKYLCDSIEKNCTNVALKNKDNLFTLRNQFDSTVFFKDATYFDSTAYFNERAYFDEDVNVKGDVIFKGYNYYFSVNNFYEHDAIVLIDEAVNPNTLGPVQSTPDNNLNRRLAVNYNDLMVVYDSLNHKAQIDNSALANRIVADSNRLVVFQNKVHEDSLTLANRIHADSVTLTSKIRTDSTALVNRIVADSSALVNRIVADSTALAEKIKADSTTLATRMDTVYKHLCDSVMNCDGIKALQTADNNLSTRIHNDSLKLVDFKTKVHNDSLTLANRIHADSVTLTNKILTDSIALVNRIVADSSALVNRIVADSTALAEKIKADSTTLATRMDTVYKHLCDSVMNCDGIKALQTADNNLSTRIHNDSLKLVDFKTKVHNDSLTLANRIHADSVTLTNKIRNDSVALVNRIVADSSALVNRIVADSAALATKEKADSAYLKGLIDNIPLANDKTITITTNGNSTGVTNGVFTLNQSTDQTIDIAVPTKLSDLPNDGGKYARRDSVNVFTENNAFTDTVTVPNGYVLRGENATNESNCGNIVVNACDLWAVFDSLNRRITALENAAPPVFNSISLTNPTIETLDVTADFTSEYIPITGYQFCYSQNSDMSEATCVPSTTNSITLTGLSSYTDYYVTASATNKVGTTTSTPVATERTLGHTPTAVLQDPTVRPLGFAVTVSGLDFMEEGEGTVQVFYKQGSNCGSTVDGYTATTVSEILHTGDSYTIPVTGLSANTSYCVIAKVTNSSGTTIVGPKTTTSGGPLTLTISVKAPSNYPALCQGSSVDLIASLSDETIAVGDYTYSWTCSRSGSGYLDGAIVIDSNTLSLKPNRTGINYDINCTATNVADPSIKLTAPRLRVNLNNRPSPPSMTLCADSMVVTPKNDITADVDWGDGVVTTNPTMADDHTYTTPGNYTVVATNSSGCSVSQTVEAKHSIVTSCVVSSPHTGGEYMNNGYNNANDGLEVTNSNNEIVSVTDYDGNVYPVVQIGSQCWLAENMRCTHSPATNNYIVKAAGATSGKKYWKSTGGKAAHWFKNDSLSYAPMHYGLLYNWCAAMDIYRSMNGEFNTLTMNWDARGLIQSPHHRGICPKGWHIPTAGEWDVLKAEESANTAAKLSTGCDWDVKLNTTKPGAYDRTDRNSSGFSALPASYVSLNSGEYEYSGTYYWSSTQSTTSGGSADSYNLVNDNNTMTKGSYYNTTYNLMSVRCVRDTTDEGAASPSDVSLTVDNDHPSVQLCTTNGNNYPYTSYYPVTVTYTAILSSENPSADLTGYTITWSVSPATLNPTIDEVNRTCTVTYSSYPYSGDPHPQIACRATKEGEPDKVVSFFQSFSTPSNVIPDCNIVTDTLTVYLRSRAASNNGTSNGISGNFTINWGDGSAAQVGPASSFTTGPEHTYNATGSYTITLTNGSGCSATREVTVTNDARFPCTGTAHTGAQYQNNGLNGTKNDGYEYTNGEGIVSVTDYDGNIYSVVQVGNQCWTRENMRCTHSPLTGTSIVNPLGASGNTFTMSKTSKVAQWYLNDQETSISKRYGLYYNWCAAMDTYYPGGNEVPQDGQSESYWSFSVTGNRRGICPKGWHIPSQSEFNELVSAAGSGTALAGSCDWNYCFGNTSDFYAVPAGEATLQFMNAGAMSDGYLYANFWSTKEYNNERVYPLRLTNPSSGESGFTSVSSSTTYSTYYKDYGASVRCVRDSE